MQLSALPGPVSPAAVVAAVGPVLPGGGAETLLYSKLVYSAIGTTQFLIGHIQFLISLIQFLIGPITFLFGLQLVI